MIDKSFFISIESDIKAILRHKFMKEPSFDINKTNGTFKEVEIPFLNSQ